MADFITAQGTGAIDHQARNGSAPVSMRMSFDDWEEPERTAPGLGSQTLVARGSLLDDWDDVPTTQLDAAPCLDSLESEAESRIDEARQETCECLADDPEADVEPVKVLILPPDCDGNEADEDGMRPSVLFVTMPATQDKIEDEQQRSHDCLIDTDDERRLIERGRLNVWPLVAAALTGALLFLAGGAAGRYVATDRSHTSLSGNIRRVLEELDLERARVESLARSVDLMGTDLKELSRRRSSPPVDVAALKQSIAETGATLQRSLDDLKIDAHFKQLASDNESIGKRLDALVSDPSQRQDKTHYVTLRPVPSQASTVSAAAQLPALLDSYLRKDYAGVDRSLKGLLPQEPRDARIWYLASLARGYSTNAWFTDPVDFARRGYELEQVNLPSRAEINAFLGRLEPGSLSWLANIRVKRPATYPAR